MAKPIKFDLPINGIKAKNLDELRDNITSELLNIGRGGMLLRWLISRNHQAEVEAIQKLQDIADDVAYFVAVCNALSVEVLTAEAEAILLPQQPAGCSLAEIRAPTVTTIENHKIVAVIDCLIELVSCKIKPNLQTVWCELLRERDRLTNAPQVNYVVESCELLGSYNTNFCIGDKVERGERLVTNGGRHPKHLVASTDGVIVFQKSGFFVLAATSKNVDNNTNFEACGNPMEVIILAIKSLNSSTSDAANAIGASAWPFLTPYYK